MSALAKVWLVTELLESILLGLAPTDLLRAQRVCQRWKRVINKSRALRQLLYLEAEGDPKLYDSCISITELRSLRSRVEAELQRAHPHDNQTSISISAPSRTNADSETRTIHPAANLKTVFYRTWALRTDSGDEITVRPNPLLEDIIQWLCLSTSSFFSITDLPDTWLYPSASWKRMHLTQPPVILNFRGNEVRDGFVKGGTIVGTRAGDVLAFWKSLGKNVAKKQRCISFHAVEARDDWAVAELIGRFRQGMTATEACLDRTQ